MAINESISMYYRGIISAMSQKTKVYCEDCDSWLTTVEPDDCLVCDCGQRFVVTVTRVPPLSA